MPNSNLSQQPKNKKKFPVPLDPNHPLTRPTTPGAIGTDAMQDNTPQPLTSTIRPKSGQQSRPTTLSKSRHGSRPTTNGAVEDRPSSTRQGLNPTPYDGSSRPPPQVVESLAGKSTFKSPFVSRPKIPRTPDSRPRTSTPPPLGRSASPPRPSSKDGRPGTSSSRKSSHSNKQ